MLSVPVLLEKSKIYCTNISISLHLKPFILIIHSRLIEVISSLYSSNKAGLSASTSLSISPYSPQYQLVTLYRYTLSLWAFTLSTQCSEPLDAGLNNTQRLYKGEI